MVRRKENTPSVHLSSPPSSQWPEWGINYDHFQWSQEAFDELSIVLWSYHMTSRFSIGETPFSLTYGTEAMLPLKILSISLRVTRFDANTNEAEQHHDMDVLDKNAKAANSA